MSRRVAAWVPAFGAAVAMLVPGGAGAASPPLLQGITCRGPAFCFAVGSSGSKPGIVRYDGAHWTTMASPAVSGGLLYGVACSSTTKCFAVGSRGPTGNKRTLVERWNGSSWQVVSTPNAPGSNELRSVACPTASFCAAAGSSNVEVRPVALVEHWNGQSWKVMANPRLEGSGYSESALTGMSCTSAKQCFAAGSTEWNYTVKTLILRWDGRAWSVSARQGANGPQKVLYGVSCASGTACMAVGQTQSDPPIVLLKDRWNGKQWSLTASPQKGPRTDLLFNAVSCASPTACLAVGNRNYSVSYAERWDGTTWSRTTPQPPGMNLSGVACPTANECYAVGGNAVERWRPGSWTTLATSS